MPDVPVPQRALVRKEPWEGELSSAWDAGVIALGSDQQIRFASARARALLGAVAEGDLQDRWRELKPHLANALRRPRSGPGPADVSAALSVDAGRRRELHIQIHNLVDDESVGHLLIIQEAEHAATIEAALRHAAQDRARSSLFPHVAHDLKGLLNVIAMNVEILSRVSHAGGPLSPDQIATAARCASVAQRELGRLDRILAVVLDRSAAEQAAPSRFDIRVTCQTLAMLVTARATRQGVTIALDVPDQPVEIIGFPDRVRGAILNLMVNALDAMPGGGILGLGITWAGPVSVTVSDTGPGVEPHLTGKIWGLHYSTKESGIGIGLYVTRAVAEAHGGRVLYYRKPDGGACFVVELPAALQP